MVLFIFFFISLLDCTIAELTDQFSAEASNYFSSYSQAPNQLTQGYGIQQQNQGYGIQQQNYGQAVPAAVQTKRTYEVKPYVLNSQPPVPSIVDVQPSEQPVQVIFRTQSSPVMVQQIHTPSQAPMVEKTNSEDEPHRVLHEVVRPVIQQVREIIQPFRHVSQEIRPVLEEVHTVVAKGQKRPPLNPYEGQFLPGDKYSPVVIGINDNNLYTNGGEYGQMALANEIVGQTVLANNPPESPGTSSSSSASGHSSGRDKGHRDNTFSNNQLLELYMSANERPLMAKTVAFDQHSLQNVKSKRRIKSRMSKKSVI